MKLNSNQLHNKLSLDLSNYLYSLKIRGRNEVYETLLLMLLNNDFLKAIENIIIKNTKDARIAEKMIKFIAHSSKKYIESVNLICKSEYFLNNFSQIEIERKRTIALNIKTEIAFQSISHLFDKNFIIYANDLNVIFPSIEHEEFSDEGIEKIKLVFYKETPLNDIVNYLKNHLDIKNTPRKKKMSLGQSFRMLQIENDIRSNPDKYKKRKYEYIEQKIAEEMKNRYKEEISSEAINKALQRIKLIKKQINTIKDK
ncbi:MAG: hypothetical protein PHQ01_02810 [Candidatus Pacebacteria bacterium]|nr:hypothetical protein [Candidatus Paceibacterota bacterium]